MSKRRGRLTKAEIRKAGGITQAWAARKKKHARKPAAKKSRARKGSQKGSSKKMATAKQKAAARRNLKKARSAKRRKHTKSPRKARRVARAAPPRRRKRKARVRRISRARIIVTAKAPRRRKRKARVRRISRARVIVTAKARRRRHHSGRRRGAMENPLGGMELFVGGITGLLGFVLADGTDRFLATHALTVKSAGTSTSPAVYEDAPTATQPYPNLKNGAAVEAPMNGLRWGVGGAITVVPFVLAHFVKAPTGRAALQFFGFGAGMRILGKGLVDLAAFVTKKTQIGQRLYVPELQAAMAANPQGATAQALPSGAPSVGLAGLERDCAPCTERKGLAAAPPPPAPETFGGMPVKPQTHVIPTTQTAHAPARLGLVNPALERRTA